MNKLKLFILEIIIPPNLISISEIHIVQVNIDVQTEVSLIFYFSFLTDDQDILLLDQIRDDVLHLLACLD